MPASLIRKPDISTVDYKGKRGHDDAFATSYKGDWNTQFSTQLSTYSSQTSYTSKSKGWDGASIPYNNSNKKTKTGFEDSYGSSTKNTWEKRDTAKMSSFASATSSQSKTTGTDYRPELSEEQERILSMVTVGKKSLFFTGSAGTGKSVLLRAIIDKLGSIYGSQLAVTASTGIAACNIGGCTLHSFGGIGMGKDKADELVRKIKFDNRKARERWINTKVLIIDESKATLKRKKGVHSFYSTLFF